MKRFLVFKGMEYYPEGGWKDFSADFDTVEDAFAHAAVPNEVMPDSSWSHVLDTKTMTIIEPNVIDGDKTPPLLPSTDIK